MLMDPMGGIVMTNDGNAILREVSVFGISRLFLQSVHKLYKCSQKGSSLFGLTVFLDYQIYYERILIY